MLHILSAQDAFHKAKVNNGSILMEPSLFSSNFFIRSADKFGIYDVPAEILHLADNQANIHHHALNGLDPYFVEMVARPIFNNKEKIFEKAINTLQNDGDLYATPGGASLFLKWLKESCQEVELNISSEFTLEDLSLEYAKLENRDSIPYALERLIKIWFFFYGKKVSRQDTRLAGFLQENIIQKKYENLEIEADKFYSIVKKTRDNETNQLPSNNIFNKLLEELYIFSNALKNGEIISDDFDIIKVGIEKINIDKQKYQALFA